VDVRRAIVVALVVGLLAAPLVGEGQQSGRRYRIGYLSMEPAPTADVPAIGLQALRQGLRRLGYRKVGTL
jgi:hypothetical protein